MTITLLEKSELEPLTREQILEKCREAGLAATAWKRGRMIAVLTGEEPAPEPKARRSEGVKLTAPAPRPLSEDGDHAAKKALESRLKRTGACESLTCAIGCQGYEEGRKDAFHWQLCTCGHTQWAHAVGEKHA